jgi:large subunit ribosomal protein L17
MSRHMNSGRKLSRNSSHRKALLQNLIRSVILSESIQTTTPKAKETRRVVEKIITAARVNTLAARRLVHKTVRDQAALAKLFGTIGPRFKTRPGGYTRLIHLQNRVGDNAPMAILELVEKSEKVAEPAPDAGKAEKTAAPAAEKAAKAKQQKPPDAAKAPKAAKAEKPPKAAKAEKPPKAQKAPKAGKGAADKKK